MAGQSEGVTYVGAAVASPLRQRNAEDLPDVTSAVKERSRRSERSDGGADLLRLCLRDCGGRGALPLWPDGGLGGTVSHVEHRPRRVVQRGGHLHLD